MEHLILAVIGWVLVFVLVPAQRVREIFMAAVIAFIWAIIVNNISVALNYYRFNHVLLYIGYAPVFHAMASAAVGLLMINWLTKNPLSKLASSVLASILLTVMRGIYARLDAFEYGRFDSVISFIHSLAAFSIFIWVASAVIGEARIYNGIKSRFQARKLAR